MIQLIFLGIILLLAVYGLSNLIASQNIFSFNKCKDCEGLGYWVGTRGDKNRCKTCEGSGKKQ